MKTEEEWIEAALQGDQEAITLLVEAYQKPVYVICYRMLGNAMEAEDAAQEAFVKAITKLHTFDTSRPFRPWLFRVTSNLCRDRLRRRKPTYSLDGMGEDGAWEWKAGTAVNPERQVEEQEQQAMIRGLLDTLSPKDRAVVTLFYWEDLSYQEIAEATDLTISAVKSRLFRARRALAEEMQALQEPATRGVMKEEAYAGYA